MKDMELDMVRKAYEHATPNVLDSVLSDCREQKGIIYMTEHRPNWGRKILSVAAMLVLVLGLGGGFLFYRFTNAPMAAVSLDVNPSIRITVNRNEKVLEAEPLNADAWVVLQNMELEGSHVNVAVNAILGSMLRNNYLNVDANTILVSVDSENAAAGEALQAKLTAEIGQTLASSNFTPAVMGQTLNAGNELRSLAEQYGISEGKAELIQKILASDSHYTFESLAKLSINELKLLTERDTMQLDNVTTSGNASSNQYIGRDAALNTALAHAGLTSDRIHDVDVEFDCDDGRMLYEVSFDAEGFEYEIDIDARTGQVLKAEKDRDDDRYDDDYDGFADFDDDDIDDVFHDFDDDR